MKPFVLIIAFILSFSAKAQTGLERFEILSGNWEGAGEGFGNAKSIILAEYT